MKNIYKRSSPITRRNFVRKVGLLGISAALIPQTLQSQTNSDDLINDNLSVSLDETQWLHNAEIERLSKIILEPIGTNSDNSNTLLSINYEGIYSFARNYWNRPCPCGNYFDSQDVAHFIGHCLSAGGVKISGGSMRCRTGIPINSQDIASAFHNSTKIYNNVSTLNNFKEAKKGDWGFLNNFSVNNHMFLLDEEISDNENSARIYSHGEFCCSEKVTENKYNDGVYFRIS